MRCRAISSKESSRQAPMLSGQVAKASPEVEYKGDMAIPSQLDHKRPCHKARKEAPDTTVGKSSGGQDVAICKHPKVQRC